MTKPAPTDFKNMIAELETRGVTLYKLALMMSEAGLRTQYVQVQRWSEGIMPRHDQGELIKAIYAGEVPRGTITN